MEKSQGKAPAASEKGKPDTWKWWYYLIAAIVVAGIAVYSYYDLTEFEATGGTRQMSHITAAVYDLLGKWGVVGLGGAISLCCLAVGITSFLRKES
jgi:hypothetical protein